VTADGYIGIRASLVAAVVQAVVPRASAPDVQLFRLGKRICGL